nr:hypothetical protein [Pseudomonas sp.]
MGKSDGLSQREGERILRRARRLYPKLDDVKALIKEAGTPPKVLATSLRRYRPCYRWALLAAGSTDIDADFSRLNKRLERRRAGPGYVRTRKEKVKDVTRAEAAATFSHLKRLVLEQEGHSAMAAGLYVLVAPRIGMRPIELIDAEVKGAVLWIRTAKARRDTPPYRTLSLKRFSETFIEALRWLCILARAGTRDGSGSTAEERFEAWRNRVAEALARASAAATGKRLALYSFRHTAIATWKASGFSAAEIAEMAGHLRLESAGHYASAKHGWTEDLGLATPASPASGADVGLANDKQMEHDAAPDTSLSVPRFQFEVDDPPMPQPAAKQARTEVDARPVHEAKADEIEATIRRMKEVGPPSLPHPHLRQTRKP